MSNGAEGGAAAAAAAIAKAIKASGAIVDMEPDEFEIILSRMDKPIVVIAESKIIKTTYQYLTSYKGFAFHTKSYTPLNLPGSTEVITAKKIWVPN